jgi:hypothetical protein
MDYIQEKFELAAVEVSWANPSHKELLALLWNLLGNSDFPGQKAEAWKSLGFQGSDPQTDFRGMGVLALQVGGQIRFDLIALGPCLLG